MPTVPYLWALRSGGAAFILLGAVLTCGRWKDARWSLGALVPALAMAGWRTAHVGHLPLAGLHETLVTFGVAVVLVSAWPCTREGAWSVFGLCLAAAGVLWCAASAVSAGPTPLVPALQTIWFEIHVLSSFLGYGCFALSAAASARRILGAEGPDTTRISREANSWGFAWFTWAMVSGGIWAYLAWGTYWLWHVKELWSGILWIYYAGLIHLPHLRGWSGRRQAALSLVGFGLVLFTYLGVGLLMRNTHQF